MKKVKLRHKLFTIFILLGLSMIVSGSVWAAFPSSQSVGVSSVRQSTSVSCWAASGSSICRYLGLGGVSENSFASSAGVSLNTMANISQVKKGFSTKGVSSTVLEDQLSLAAIKNEIYYDRTPVFANFYEHAMVLDGYYYDDLIFMDPSDGLGWQMTYNEAVNGVDGSIFAWIRTLYNFSR